MVFVYFARDSDGLEAATAIVSWWKRHRRIYVFSGGLCEKNRLRSAEASKRVRLEQRSPSPATSKKPPNSGGFCVTWGLYSGEELAQSLLVVVFGLLSEKSTHPEEKKTFFSYLFPVLCVSPCILIKKTG